MTSGHRQPWATRMYEGSALAIAQGSKEDKIRADFGKVLPEVRSRSSLTELHARLSPSIPIVHAIGIRSGSGFLIEHDGQYLVVTNRHVIADASRGVALQFLKGTERSKEITFTIPPADTFVSLVHRAADLAVIDVTRHRGEIEKNLIRPLKLAPQLYVPPPGEDVFAIGHPGGAGKLLTQTLSPGIVSAVGDVSPSGRAIQITAPTNPGNSGGPLFDLQGRIVGITTFGALNTKGQTLQALNFALEISQVYELLNEPSKYSLSQSDIVALLSPKVDSPEMGTPLPDVPETPDATPRQRESFRQSLRIPPGGTRHFFLSCSAKKKYVALVSGTGNEAIHLAVYTPNGVLLNAVRNVGPRSVQFHTLYEGEYVFYIVNALGRSVSVSVNVLEE